MLKKIARVVMVVMIIIGIYSNVNAAQTKTTLEVIQKSSEKVLENVQGNITKTIVNSKSEQGEITIELKFKNNKEDRIIPPEVFFVIDTSRKYGDKNKYWKNKKNRSYRQCKRITIKDF